MTTEKLAPEKLSPKTAQELLDSPIKGTEQLVEGILPLGLVIIAGDPKVGKSWFVLLLAICLTTGATFLGRATKQVEVLYLCLEDTFARIQSRLQLLVDEANDLLHIDVAAEKIATGLIDQLDMYMQECPKTRVIIIDTLQVVRAPVTGSVYAADYEDMGALKRFADDKNICIVVVHHTRKMSDTSNIFNRVSGSNGIMGAADATMVLARDKIMENVATLSIIGRDVEAAEFELEQVDCRWELASPATTEIIRKRAIPPVVIATLEYIKERDIDWEGTASQFITAANLANAKANTLTKYLNEHRNFLEENGIRYDFRRSGKARTFSLTRIVSVEEDDA